MRDWTVRLTRSVLSFSGGSFSTRAEDAIDHVRGMAKGHAYLLLGDRVVTIWRGTFWYTRLDTPRGMGPWRYAEKDLETVEARLLEYEKTYGKGSPRYTPLPLT
jgi:hypothetical protein